MRVWYGMCESTRVWSFIALKLIPPFHPTTFPLPPPPTPPPTSHLPSARPSSDRDRLRSHLDGVVQAGEDFNIEKVRLVQSEKKKMMLLHERRSKQAEVQKKIEYSNQLNQVRTIETAIKRWSLAIPMVIEPRDPSGVGGTIGGKEGRIGGWGRLEEKESLIDDVPLPTWDFGRKRVSCSLTTR